MKVLKIISAVVLLGAVALGLVAAVAAATDSAQ